MFRPWNFSAGPASLPETVLHQIASEMLDWHGTGISVMEMSHRSDYFLEICNTAESDLRELLDLSEDYSILFMQGGGSGQNAFLPMNLIGKNGNKKMADFVLTGYWSNRSYQEAKRYGNVSAVANNNFSVKMDHHIQPPLTWIPPQKDWKIRNQTSYLHLCSNETINGVEFSNIPSLKNFDTKNISLVIDASSNFLSRPLDITRADVIFAAAQKNAGPAGVTIVIIRKDLMGYALPICPSTFDYINIDKSNSCYNTPPTFSIYVCGLLFKWIRKNGGIKSMGVKNKLKASMLYKYIDSSSFYRNFVHKSVRSKMNVPFFLIDNTLEDIFLEEAKKAGLLGLKGHKALGGLRASIYNATPIEGVRELIVYMKDFERRYG